MRKLLLNFIEMLGQHNYFALPLGDIIINYIVKLSQSDSSVSRDQAEGGPMGGSLQGREQEEGTVGNRREGRIGYGWHTGRALASKT